jgi:electron transfer flavoprotein alpha/beta subunit
VKVLLDENLDHALRKLLGPHEVVPVTYMGWTGLQNGALLRAAEESGMDVLLTGDQTLNYEQSLTGRRLAIVALSVIQLPIIKESLAKIIAAVDAAAPGSFQAVDCGTFSRKKTPKE